MQVYLIINQTLYTVCLYYVHVQYVRSKKIKIVNL